MKEKYENLIIRALNTTYHTPDFFFSVFIFKRSYEPRVQVISKGFFRRLSVHLYRAHTFHSQFHLLLIDQQVKFYQHCSTVRQF